MLQLHTLLANPNQESVPSHAKVLPTKKGMAANESSHPCT